MSSSPVRRNIHRSASIFRPLIAVHLYYRLQTVLFISLLWVWRVQTVLSGLSWTFFRSISRAGPAYSRRDFWGLQTPPRLNFEHCTCKFGTEDEYEFVGHHENSKIVTPGRVDFSSFPWINGIFPTYLQLFVHSTACEHNYMEGTSYNKSSLHVNISEIAARFMNKRSPVRTLNTPSGWKHKNGGYPLRQSSKLTEML